MLACRTLVKASNRLSPPLPLVVRHLSEQAGNPVVFLDVAIGFSEPERLEIVLRADVAPKTAENFRALCTGENGTTPAGNALHFKGVAIHRVIPGFMAQGGDISHCDGLGGESVYGGSFNDENFILKHDQAGIISMANVEKDSNGSQFFIVR